MIKKLENIIKEMGYRTEKGIGSETEIFVFDENDNSITCTVIDNKVTAVSNKDVENETYPEYFTANLDDKDDVIIGIEYAMCKDRSFC